MDFDSTGIELSCDACSWRRAYVGDEARQLQLPANHQPLDRQRVRELLAGQETDLVCPECRTPGLQVRTYLSDDEDWQQAVVCEVCRKPVPLERLEALPGVRRCVACQHTAELGVLAAEPEYCPKCGSPLILRMSRSAGIARYKLFCSGTPSCRL